MYMNNYELRTIKDNRSGQHVRKKVKICHIIGHSNNTVLKELER